MWNIINKFTLKVIFNFSNHYFFFVLKNKNSYKNDLEKYNITSINLLFISFWGDGLITYKINDNK